ncbi:MAG: hypothetical protein NT062_28720, partial [Proteobacteria bacterium]|nr:hypothetical protein [Pseudomonadota bacterium]
MNALVRGVLHKITRAAETAPAWSERAEATVRSLAGVVSPVCDPLIAVVRASAVPRTARVVAYEAALAITAAVDPAAAVALGELLLAEVEASPAAHQALALCYRAVYAIERPRVLLERARALGGSGMLAFAPLARLNDLARWAAQGLPLSPPQPRAYEPEPRRVVYVVSSSHPYHAVGYTTRSHALVTALGRRGWDMHIVARAGYP